MGVDAGFDFVQDSLLMVNVPSQTHKPLVDFVEQVHRLLRNVLICIQQAGG